MRSLSPETQARLALILGGAVIALFLSTLVGFFSIRDEAREDDCLDETARLARAADTDFQLAISKGKNFAILKDSLNKTRTLAYFKQAQDDFAQLSKREQDPEGRRLLFQLGAALQSSEFPLGILTSTAKKGDSPEKLYSRYLKDITTDFDNASRSYLVFLDGKIQGEESELNGKILLDLLLALAGILMGLGGMGLSFSTARRLNQALKNESVSQERYRMLSEAAEEAILIHDRGIIVDVNPALTRMLGYPVPELIGRHLSQFMDQASTATTGQRIREGYPEHSYEITARRKDGTTFPLSVHGRDIEYEGRKLRLSCGWDMTEWKKTEEDLRENRERFERFAEVTKEGILIHENGIIIDVNEALLEMTGMTRAELVGSDGALALSEESAEKIDEFRRTGYPLEPYEITIRRKDGSFLPVEVHGRPFSYGGRTLRVASFWDLTERNKTEAALRRSEERFRAILENSYEAITLLSEDGKTLYVSPSNRKLTGYEAEERLGRNVFEMTHPDDLPRVGEAFQRLRGTPGKTMTLQARIRHKTGDWRVAEFTATNLLHNPDVAGILINARDVTEKVRAEEALAQKERYFRALIEKSYDAFILIGPDRLVRYVSPAMKDLYGWSPEDRAGRNSLELVHPEDKDRAMEFAETLLSKPGGTQTIQIRFRHKDGHYVTTDARGTNLLEDPDIHAVVINYRDVTEKVRAEETVRQKERYFRALIEKSYDAILLIGADGKIAYGSPGMANMYGYRPEERVGQDSMDLIHPEDREIARKTLTRLTHHPRQSEIIRVRLRHKEGHYLIVEIRATNLLGDPDVNGVVVNFRDVTEKVKAEEALRQSEDKFRSLIENSHDVISISGKDRAMAYISPSVKRVLGYEPSERIGQGYAEIMHPDDVERIKGEFGKLGAMPGATWTVRFRLRHKDGSWRMAESTGTNLLENPAVRGIVYNLRDITEEVEAQTALENRERYFRSLIDKLYDVLMVMDKEGAITFISPSVERVLGYAPEELRGVKTIELMHPDDAYRPGRVRAVQAAKTPGAVASDRARLRHKDGSWRTVDYTGVSLVDDPAVQGVVTIFHDVTEKVEAEESLRKSEENFRNLIEKSPDAVLVHRDGKIVYANLKLPLLLGYDDAEELIGKPSTFAVHPDDQKAIVQRIQTLSQGGKTSPIEIRLIRRDGAVLPVETASINIQFEGAPAVMVNIRDITARKQAEAEARETQERYRSLVESMPDAVMIHDEEAILYVNPAALRTFGAKSEEEFLGKPFWILVTPEFRDSIRARVRAIIERGVVNELAERKIRRLDGSLIDVLVTSVPFNDHGRRVVLAIFLDVTALKEAERRALRYQRLAALGEMAAGMAHEIRNPTAAISAQAQYLLKKTEGNNAAYEQLKDIIQQCERLETLVHDTLDYSPEKRFEERTEIPAKDLLQKALWLAQTQFGPSHARVKVILDSTEDMPLLRVHPTRMDRVLVNLILNAFQAMPEGGHLLLGAKRVENKVVLRVQDDGKGITDEEMARLFEPFYTSRKMGSGLGLAICQKIVEEHQGKIKVERVEPHGAAFVIELPLNQENS